ncbi:phage recombination protein Bet [Lysinibacter cavernae]|uniref:Phage recombination protein Bet n=1 Tax=Lysinibacter cavernae TaxID=1640652 RepID=A0A7X5QZ48_9MICO|nr:phage recombination protein Bet [Lysinibacter cavernae]NIH52520.1 phage recombination protein Bet [Lysinibacter cavernae]
MSSTAVAVKGLPVSSDVGQWSSQETAFAQAIGLVKTNGQGKLIPAPRETIEAFLHQCRRTGLDPVARQIYCIERGGKYGIQVSIDGARLVAERTGQYEGQTPAEWTADGITWVAVWLSDQAPAAGRVGVYRAGFRDPVYGVARFSSYSTGQNLWRKMPEVMIAKCAEMLALRKAFPQDLSGLYSSEEMEQAGGRTAAAPRAEASPHLLPAEASAPAAEAVQVFSQDWVKRAALCRDYEELRPVFAEAQAAGELGIPVDASGKTLNVYLRELKASLPEKAEPVAAESNAPAVDDTGWAVPGGDAAAPVTDWPTTKVPGEAVEGKANAATGEVEYDESEII